MALWEIVIVCPVVALALALALRRLEQRNSGRHNLEETHAVRYLKSAWIRERYGNWWRGSIRSEEWAIGWLVEIYGQNLG